MASNPAEPEPPSASASGHEREPAERRSESPSQSRPGAAPAGERFGPLVLERAAKEDGRQLILYAHDRET